MENEKEFRQALGNLFRNKRRDQGKTMQQVADSFGPAKYIICNVENGKLNPTLSTLIGLAKALGCKLKITLE